MLRTNLFFVPAEPRVRATGLVLLLVLPMLLLMLFLITPALFAQDGDFSSGFGGGFDSEDSGGFSSEENSANNAGDAGSPSTGFGLATDFTPSSTALEWNGFVETTLRGYLDYSDPASGTLDHYPALGLDLSYTGENSEVLAELRFSRNWAYDTPSASQDTDPQNISWYLQRMINQAYIRLYYDHFDLQTGYLKEVWGTGDQSHVVDVLNPMDYYDFVNIDYLDRKVSEFMVKINIPLGLNGLLELVYVPTFTPDSSPVTGMWVPAGTRDLLTLTGLTARRIQKPKKTTLADGQYAARCFGTLGNIDLAGTYYYGYLRSPNIDIDASLPPTIYLIYDRYHLFGLDFAAVLAGFNLRGEAAYYLTEDLEGEDDTRLNNHSFQYVAGFDRNLPISELNLSIQSIGAYYLNEDDDPDYHVVSAALKDSWNNNRINPQVSLSYNVDEQDIMLRPKITFTLADDAELTTEYALFHGDTAGRFGQFDDNDYLQVSLRYAF